MRIILKPFKFLLILIFFIAFFMVLYNVFKDDRYIFLGKDAPIPNELHPIVSEKKDILVRKAERMGINIIITGEFRSFEKQSELYQQGRAIEGNIVTYAKAGESYHNYGLAIDYALINDNDEITWDIQYDGNNNGSSDWFEVADMAKDLGFEWGGDWSNFKDYPHLQMTFGLSIRKLQMGYRPKEIQE